MGLPVHRMERLRPIVRQRQGMHKLGKSPALPVCGAGELDQPGGVQWHGGLRPILQDTLRTGTTLLDIVSGRLANALAAVMLPITGGTGAAIRSALAALDNYSLRGSDHDGSIAAAAAALHIRVDAALDLCESMAA